MAVWIVLVIAVAVVVGYMLCRYLRQGEEGRAWVEGFYAGRDDERMWGDWCWPTKKDLG
jgi:hypothetical protein